MLKIPAIPVLIFFFTASCQKYNYEDAESAFAQNDLATLIDMRAYSKMSLKADEYLSEYFRYVRHTGAKQSDVQIYEKYIVSVNNILSNRLAGRDRKMIQDSLRILYHLGEYEALIQKTSYGTAGYAPSLKTHLSRLEEMQSLETDPARLDLIKAAYIRLSNNHR